MDQCREIRTVFTGQLSACVEGLCLPSFPPGLVFQPVESVWRRAEYEQRHESALVWPDQAS